jgi:ornithine carbamoyltransferase
MTIDLHSRSFLTLLDFSPAEIRYLLDLSHQLKQKRQQGIIGSSLRGKNIALLFEKTSTRTRCAFEIGVIEEGGHPSFIDISSSQFGKKESVEDSARVLAGFYHGIEFRGYSQKTVEDLAKYSGIPVYNGLTDEDHPTQILADLMTIEEALPHKPLNQVKVVYVGDTRNNMANAWMYGCAKMGMHFVAYGPSELNPAPESLNKALACAKENGATIEVSSDPACLASADVIYTDVWVSMGEEDQIVNRANLLKDYQITMDMLKQTNNPEVLFMHCLPAFHDCQTKFVSDASQNFGVDVREVSDEVFRSKHSIVFREAENRLHSIKAILVATLGNPNHNQLGA